MTDPLQRALTAAAEGVAEQRRRLVRRQAKKALGIAPDHADAHAYLAWAELASDQFEAALVALAPALAAAPDREWYHRLRALALARQGQLDEAAVAVDEAIRLAPDQGLAHALQAQVRFMQGQVELAQVLARKAVELLPADPLPCRLLGDYHLRDDPEEAEKWYRDSLDREAGQAVLLNNLGVALRALGRGTEADSVQLSAEMLDSSLSLRMEQLERWDARLVGLEGRRTAADEDGD
jgi:tetratricopeptide (TPR) repeat protein